ncbi:MAG: SIMPL domain-containing protein [Candidatus Margulisiibacteriota bacterium]|nr:SIMPL domain-containing protein [Candidatus Margulisiibacteriota bacterium]
MLKRVSIFTLFVILVSPAFCIEKPDDAAKIIVSGHGSIKVEADLSYVNLAIEELKDSASQAQKQAAQKMQSVLSALQKIGIKKKDIQTTSFRLNPKYKYEKGRKNLIGYTATNQIRVTLNDLSKVGEVIDTAISAGANNVSNVAFTVEDNAPHKRAALKNAFNNAKEKAKAIAAAADLRLKKILNISESGARVITPYTGVRAMKAETPIVPGKVEVRGHLTVTYECIK